MSEPVEITNTLNAIERASTPPRELAREAVRRHRERRLARPAIDPDYDFEQASRETKQIVYDAAVRFSRRRLWSRLLR